MKKILTIISIIITSIALYACKPIEKFDIVTTMYPSYDIARNIVLDKLTVTSLVKPGVEAHDYQPSSKQIVTVKESKLFIFTSYDFDTWLNDDVTKTLTNNEKYINLEDEIKDLTDDHHFWTNPIIYMKLISIIKDEIILIDPTNKDFYEKNANEYSNKIMELHLDLFDYLKDLVEPTIYFAGHNALHSFEDIYNLEIISLSNTTKPDAELTNKQITELTEQIINTQTKYLFIEELTEPRIAKTIQKELKNKSNYTLELLELHSYHNVTKKQFDDNVSYYDLFKQNIINIKIALEDINV